MVSQPHHNASRSNASRHDASRQGSATNPFFFPDQAPRSLTPKRMPPEQTSLEASPFKVESENSGFPEIVAPESSQLAALDSEQQAAARKQLDDSIPEVTATEAAATEAAASEIAAPAALPSSQTSNPYTGFAPTFPATFPGYISPTPLSPAPLSPAPLSQSPAPTPAVPTPPAPAPTVPASSPPTSPVTPAPAQSIPSPPATGNLIPFPQSALQQSLQEQAEFVIPLRNDEYLPALSRWTTWGGLVLLTAVGTAAGLAAVTPAPVLVRAGALVRPQGELKVVQAIADGTIQTIKVEEGQQIHRGQPLAILDDSRLQTRQRQLETGLQQRQMQLQQIQAQVATLDTQSIAEKNLTERSVASARAEVLRIEREHADRKAIAEKEVQESEALLAAARVEYESYAEAAAAGVLPRVQAENKRQAYNAAQARLERAQTQLNPSTAGITMAQESIAQTVAQGESTLASLQRQREALLQQQSQIRQQIGQDEQELAQVTQEFDKMVIRAQTDGELLKLNLRNEGQVVRSGETIAQVFPKDAPLEIKAKVSPQDIGKVELGQRVNMRVSAYSYADYGTLEGIVTAIGADAIAPQTQLSPTTVAGNTPPYFEVTIQPEQSFLVKNNQQYEITPGMEIQADIVARDETVLTLMLRKSRLLTGL